MEKPNKIQAYSPQWCERVRPRGTHMRKGETARDHPRLRGNFSAPGVFPQVALAPVFLFREVRASMPSNDRALGSLVPSYKHTVSKLHNWNFISGLPTLKSTTPYTLGC